MIYAHNLSIKSLHLDTVRDRVQFRIGHVAVAYKDAILLWGGHKDQDWLLGNDDYFFDPHELCVFDCHREKWFIRIVEGDLPPRVTSPGAAVLGDALYVYGGFVFGRNIDTEDGEDLYKLDLITLKWHKLNPKGVAPLPSNKMAAWSYGNKVYFFGGFGRQPRHRHKDFTYVEDGKGKAWNNQLVAYNTETDQWEWPTTRGKTPVPRAAHACDISGSEVYIMGGRVSDVRMHDLYSLNLKTMTWSENLGDAFPDDPKPEGRSWHTLTFFAPDKAVMYGGYNTESEILDDCWILETKRPVRFRSFNSVFGTKRFWHRSVYNPVTRDIVCIGGISENIPGFILMNFLPKSLLRLCVDAVLQAKERTLPYWSELPKTLSDYLVKRERWIRVVNL